MINTITKGDKMETIKFYTKGKYMGYRKMSADCILEVVSWIKSGNDIKIGHALINNPVCAVNLIQSNTRGF